MQERWWGDEVEERFADYNDGDAGYAEVFLGAGLGGTKG